MKFFDRLFRRRDIADSFDPPEMIDVTPRKPKSKKGLWKRFLLTDPTPASRPLKIPLPAVTKILPPIVHPRALPAAAKLAIDDSFSGDYELVNGSNVLGQSTGFLGYAFLSELNTRTEFRTINEVFAEEMSRESFRLLSKSEEDKSDKINTLMDMVQHYRVNRVLFEAFLQDAQFGRAQIYLDVTLPDSSIRAYDDQTELTTPLMYSKAKITRDSLKAFKVIEPIWTYPSKYNTDRPMRQDFYVPSEWYVLGQRIDSTRLLTMISTPVPDILKPAYNFGGLSLTQLSIPYVENWLRTRDSISDLIHSFSTSGISTDMASILEDGEDLRARAELFNRYRDNKGLMMLNKDTEEFFQFNTPLGGLSDIQAQAQEQMSLPNGIPLVKLWGITPKGLNATSDGEIRVFYDKIKARQKRTGSPALKIMLDIMQISEFGEIDPDIVFEWNDLYRLDGEALARVRKSDGEAAIGYIQEGVISPEEERTRLADDPNSAYHGIEADKVPEPPEEDIDQSNPEAMGTEDPADAETQAKKVAAE